MAASIMCLLAACLAGSAPGLASAEAEQTQCPAQTVQQCSVEGEWRDTALLASLWEAVASGNTDTLDDILDFWGQYAISARASDGRGLAFWGFEFKSAYALGALLALGGDPESSDEDVQGATAASLCDFDRDCDRAKLMREARALVPDIKKRRDERTAPCLYDVLTLFLFRLILIFCLLPLPPAHGAEAPADTPART